MTDQQKPLTRLVRYGVCHDDNMRLHAPMEDGYWTPWHIAEALLAAAEANKQAAINAALESVAQVETDAEAHCLAEERRCHSSGKFKNGLTDNLLESEDYWAGRRNGHRVASLNIRSRISTNPLTEAQARIAELEAELTRTDECIIDGLIQRKELNRKLAELDKLCIHHEQIEADLIAQLTEVNRQLEEARKDENALFRLEYLYRQQMNALVKPLITFDEWLTNIDAAMKKEQDG